MVVAENFDCPLNGTGNGTQRFILYSLVRILCASATESAKTSYFVVAVELVTPFRLSVEAVALYSIVLRLPAINGQLYSPLILYSSLLIFRVNKSNRLYLSNVRVTLWMPMKHIVTWRTKKLLVALIAFQFGRHRAAQLALDAIDSFAVR